MHIEESLTKTVLNSWKSVTHRFNEVISQFSATNDGLFPLLGTADAGTTTWTLCIWISPMMASMIQLRRRF